MKYHDYEFLAWHFALVPGTDPAIGRQVPWVLASLEPGANQTLARTCTLKEAIALIDKRAVDLSHAPATPARPARYYVAYSLATYKHGEDPSYDRSRVFLGITPNQQASQGDRAVIRQCVSQGLVLVPAYQGLHHPALTNL